MRWDRTFSSAIGVVRFHLHPASVVFWCMFMLVAKPFKNTVWTALIISDIRSVRLSLLLIAITRNNAGMP